jgi:ADP-ribose pyrophosphatase YjhB (NUDIX family)
MTWTTYAGAGVVVERDGRVLLVRQRRHYGTHWELPSGYVEGGESFEQAAAREVLEEAAIAVEVGDLLCTMVWEREHDRRRNLLAFFLATAVDGSAEPRPQLEEDIDAAAFLDPRAVDPVELHPLNQAIFDRWWDARETGFHLHADVRVDPGGTQSYVF